MDIRAATFDDVDRATETIALAFATDPVWGVALAGADGSDTHHLPYWRLFVGSAQRQGGLHLLDGGAAVSVWIPPGGLELADDGLFALEALAQRALGPAGARELEELFERFDVNHPHHAPHAYLSLLATHPDHRGRGIGQSLLGANLAEWDAAHGGDCGVKVAVNISAIQLQRDSVPAMVADALGRHNVAGDRVTLELTESAIVQDPDRIARIMHALKDHGATLAMDDFGTGYSNLAYLQKLPIDVLKIDRSFVSGMLADRDKVAIVRAILSLSHALGMQTTAEGIETPELAQTLAALGCTYGQGFLYARPLAKDDALQLLADRNS